MIWDFLAGPRYTNDELMARLKFFIGIILGLTLFGIVFVVLYSLIFVTQPMNGMSPVDNKFFELIIPVATFLTGTLSGIMLAGDDKELRAKALEAANKPPPPSAPIPSPAAVTVRTPLGSASFNPINRSAEPEPVAAVSTGFGGKPAPAPAPQPEI